MKKTFRYSELVNTGQYGRLYVTNESYRYGHLFWVFVLPEGEQAIPSYLGPLSPPENKDAVKVFGENGWIHDGPWVNDFKALIKEKSEEKQKGIDAYEAKGLREKQVRKSRELNVLGSY